MSRRDHLAPASTADIITTASGLALWPDSAIRAYMATQRRKAFIAEISGSAVPLASVLCFVEIFAYLFPSTLAFSLFGVYTIGAALTLWSCMSGSEWRTNACSPGGVYWRDSVEHRLPPTIARIMGHVYGMLPNARAYVSFVGRDPVLHVEVEGTRYHVVVWDELSDGTIKILEPPLA